MAKGNLKASDNKTEDIMLTALANTYYDGKTKIICPHCGEEAEVDTSMVLTSYPPKYAYHCKHCGITGYIFCSELGNYTHVHDLAVTSTKCIICGEETTFIGEIDQPFVCDKCKKAILKMRKQLGD